MKNVFNYKKNSLSDEILEFNLSELLKRQFAINKKFPNPLYSDNRKYSEVFDSYFVQISEEIYEYNMNLEIIDRKCNINRITQDLHYQEKLNASTDDTLEELIDVFMYYHSLFALLSEEIMNKDFINKNKIYEIKLQNVRSLINLTFNSNRDYLKDITLSTDLMKMDYSFVYALRRQVLDRKYHKPAKGNFDDYKNKLLSSLILFEFANIPTIDTELNTNINNIFDFNKFKTELSPLYYIIIYCVGISGGKVFSETKNCIDKINTILNNKESHFIDIE
jgi:hypothetical protein